MAKQTFTTGQVLTAAQQNTLQANDYNQTVSVKTANYSLLAADKGTRIEFNTSGSVTCTVNSGQFDAGDTLVIQNRGAGAATVTAGTATVNTSASLVVKQYDSGVLYFVSDSSAIYFASDAADTPLTTKGDLFTFSTAADRLAVGSNGETLVADSSATTGLRYQGNFAAGKNQCINGAFNVWQRGTSFAGNVYTADRWTTQTDKTLTVSQQSFTAGAAPVAGYESAFFLRQTYSAGGSYGALQTKLEDVRLFAGQTITLSYWAKADATYSNTPSVTQNFGSGGSVSVGTNGTTHNITTTWTRYSSVITVPSISGKTIGTSSFFMLQPILIESAGARTIDIWGVQVEIGSVATAFQTATGTLAGELSACQRYFWAPSINDNVMGNAYSTSAAYFAIPYAVPMRVVPTPTYPGTLTSVVGDLVSAVNRTPTAVASYVMSGTDFASWTATGMTGLVAGYPVTFRSNITWSAEL